MGFSSVKKGSAPFRSKPFHRNVGSDSSVLLASAIALAIGMGIQNFPEGAAIALPLRQSGMSRAKAFGLGTDYACPKRNVQATELSVKKTFSDG